MKIYIICLCCCLTSLSLLAQKSVDHGIDWKNVVYDGVSPNGERFNWKLSDFKGKLTILDFWNKGCSSCLTGMPKMYALSQQFKDDVHIMTVTDDNLEDVLKVFERLKGGRYEFLLPAVYADTAFKSVFKFQAVPYFVWIDENGDFLASTSVHVVTPEVIQEVLEGRVHSLHANAILTPLDFQGLTRNTAIVNDFVDTKQLFSVGLTKYNRSARVLKESGLNVDNQKVGFNYQYLNKTLYDLIKSNLFASYDSLARVFYDDSKNKRMIVSDRIRSRYLDTWQIYELQNEERMNAIAENYFCMEINSDVEIPIVRRKKAMMDVLQAFFDIEVSREIRKVDVLRITKVPPLPKKMLKIGEPLIESELKTVAQLVRVMNIFFGEGPIVLIDEEELRNQMIHLIFNNTLSYDDFYQQLLESGFKFENIKVDMEMIVVD